MSDQRVPPTPQIVLRPQSDKNEREAEYEFVMSRIVGQRVLDVGYVEGKVLDLIPHALGVDQRNTGKYPGREYLADLVKGLPFEDKTFDTVICISTLEHMGMGHYGDPIYTGNPLETAFAELVRVTAGRLIVTVPIGLYIPNFVHYIEESTLTNWSSILPMKELTFFVWQPAMGKFRTEKVAAAVYERQ